MALTDVNLFRIDGTVGSVSNVQTSALNGGPLAGTRNRIINGDMRIDQRNAGASVTPANGAYTLDRWITYNDAASKYSIQQSSTAPAGFTTSALITSLSAYTVGASEAFLFGQKIEGFNVADLAWGTASAKTVTLSFWVRSSLTGTFGGSIGNGSDNRWYPISYTISAANTWEQKTITIAGDITGTWNTDNTNGMNVYFSLGTGSTYSGTAGTWGSSVYYSATGATSVVGTNGATFYITGVQLEAGTVATPFERIDYSESLRRCQRYYENVGGGFGRSKSSGAMDFCVNYLTEKRSSPSVTLRAGSWSVTQIGFGARTLTALSSVYNAQTQMCAGALAATSFTVEENGYLVSVPLAVSAEL